MMEKMDVLVKESLDRVRASKWPAGTQSKGLIFAEGDSWFDYWPIDILDKLEERYFDVECVAGANDRLLDMADMRWQRDRLTKKMQGLADSGRRPDVILISGGGNDLAEEGVLCSLLNPAWMQLPILNENAVKAFIEGTMLGAYMRLLGFISSLSKQLFGDRDPIRILVHGYSYPVPDGRALAPGVGPWLKPEFVKRGYSDLVATTAAMQTLLDRFNDMVEGLPKKHGFGHVKYVNLRHCFSNDLKGDRYKDYWENEMHPTPQGFSLVADEFMKHIPGAGR